MLGPPCIRCVSRAVYEEGTPCPLQVSNPERAPTRVISAGKLCDLMMRAIRCRRAHDVMAQSSRLDPMCREFSVCWGLSNTTLNVTGLRFVRPSTLALS